MEKWRRTVASLLSLEVSGDGVEGEDSRRGIPVVVSWKAIGCRMFRKCRRTVRDWAQTTKHWESVTTLNLQYICTRKGWGSENWQKVLMLTLSAGVLGLKLESYSNLTLAFWFALFCLLNKGAPLCGVFCCHIFKIYFLYSVFFFFKKNGRCL